MDCSGTTSSRYTLKLHNYVHLQEQANFERKELDVANGFGAGLASLSLNPNLTM